ncbi:MFS transporter [Tropicibacter oceani]|uniref:MFS transporter n=1 Tax=Tropicibacter oceani TaxID=3058420 RepID=A0ABY8QNZ3_9RHOB|nr:MFS transporter [Tropicibacter oceani]WGW05673.1 MFS transporter [Tropicibacter oceani]
MFKDLYLARGPLAAFVAEGLAWGSFAALVPALKPQAGLSDAALGTALLVAAVMAFGAMWAAPHMDRLLRNWTMPILLGVMVAGFLLASTAAGWGIFALAMALAAIGAGSTDVAMNARISVLEAAHGRPLMNMAHGIFSLSYAIAAISGGLAREAGLSPLQVYLLIGAVILGLVLVMLAAPVSDSDAEPGTRGGAPLRWGFLLPVGAIVLIGFMAEQATEGWSALHLERTHGAGAAEGALGPAILGLTMAVGRFSGQALAHRLDEAAVLRWAAGLAALGALVAAWGPGLGYGYAGFAMLGLGVSVVAPMAFAWAGRMTASGSKALAISRVAVLGYAGFFIGPPIMGFLSQGYGLSISFTAMAVGLGLIPLVLVGIVARRG